MSFSPFPTPLIRLPLFPERLDDPAPLRGRKGGKKREEKGTGYFIAPALPDNPLEYIQIDIPATDDGDHVLSLEAICVLEEAPDGETPRILDAQAAGAAAPSDQRSAFNPPWRISDFQLFSLPLPFLPLLTGSAFAFPCLLLQPCRTVSGWLP